MSSAIEVKHLCHQYGSRTIYRDLNFTVPTGTICGLLGKNGQGKTTLVNILMGFLKPTSGRCLVLGEDSFHLPPSTRARIGLLHEGHLAYEFLTIAQTERFFSGFYPGWEREIFFDLVNKMGLSPDHKICRMSCGQRSQVVLGVIMAQNPDLLILDDYSMGLDAGYRRLFLDVLKDFAALGNKTIFVTSHIVQDLEKLVDSMIFIDRGEIMQTELDSFMNSFHCYDFEDGGELSLVKDEVICGFDQRGERISVFSFADKETVQCHLDTLGVHPQKIREKKMSLEGAFIGLMGKY